MRKRKRQTAQVREIINRANHLRTLLQEFGAQLYGFDPGVSAQLIDYPEARGHGAFSEPLSFNSTEWQWLEPLLVELRELRKKAGP